VLEILIKEIIYQNNQLVLLPLGCPDPNGTDIPKHSDNSPACLLGTNKCPYLDSVQYSHVNMKRALFCTKVQV